MKASWFLVGALALGACYTDGSSDLVRGGPEGVPPLDHPTGAGLSASPRRMSADQWRASLPVIFGNGVDGKPITWVVAPNKPALDVPTTSAAFGEPDYLTTTAEDLEPSVLYAKFTDDAARSVCFQVRDADLARTDAKTRVLVREASFVDTVASNPTAVNANLRYLKLRFHGVRVTEDAALEGLRKVFTASRAGSTATTPEQQGADGWLGVCVALVTAPEFHVY
jgi:hypothetical protein